jgi:cell filamentation protein
LARIGRYQAATGPEGEYQPRSNRRVLRNHPGITRKRVLDRLEYDALVSARERSFHAIGAETRFQAALICELHRDWLEEIYPWAGSYRTVELSKAGFRWPPAFRVAENMKYFETNALARLTPCVPAPLEVITRAIAKVHADLLLIHPFRDGNGRLARWIADLMALQAGLPPPLYGLEGRGATVKRAAYLAAVQRGYLGDYSALALLFAEAIRRRG